MKMRYPAPASFTHSYRRADSRSTTDSPRAEAVAWQRHPRQMPKVVKKAAVRPRLIAFLVTSPVSAPGIMVNSAAMPRKATKRESMRFMGLPTVDVRNRLPASEFFKNLAHWNSLLTGKITVNFSKITELLLTSALNPENQI